MPDGILLRFANEEMVYLLRSLQISNFPGLAPEPLKSLSDEQKALLMTEADHTLRARGLVHWLSETEREIAPLVSKMLRDCAQPRYTLFVDLLDAHTVPTKRLYIIGADSLVEQCEPEPQVQQYLLIPSQEDFLERLQTLVIPLQEKTPAPELPGGQLSSSLWLQTLQAGQENEEGAYALLARNLPAPTAAALATALHDFQQIRYLARWRQTPTPEQPSPDAALMLIAGHDRLFLLWQEEADRSLLHVIPAGTQDVQGYITRLARLEV